MSRFWPLGDHEEVLVVELPDGFSYKRSKGVEELEERVEGFGEHALRRGFGFGVC